VLCNEAGIDSWAAFEEHEDEFRNDRFRKMDRFDPLPRHSPGYWNHFFTAVIWFARRRIKSDDKLAEFILKGDRGFYEFYNKKYHDSNGRRIHPYGKADDDDGSFTSTEQEYDTEDDDPPIEYYSSDDDEDPDWKEGDDDEASESSWDMDCEEEEDDK
jgi:hypothetical protein